jgi:hypothetical protein
MIALRNEFGLPAARLSRLRKLHTPYELCVNRLRSHTYSLRVPTVNVWLPFGANVKFSVSSMVFVSSWLPCENWSAPARIVAFPVRADDTARIDLNLREAALRIATVVPLVVSEEQLVRRAVAEVREQLKDRGSFVFEKSWKLLE